MSEYPDWLPNPVEYHGDWDSFIRTLYRVFETDFKQGRPRYQNCPIWHDRRIDSEDKFGFEEGFWHLVTRNEWVWNSAKRIKEKQRLPDNDRAARLPWAKPTIDHDSEPEIKVWDFEEAERSNVVRRYIWLEEYDFVVILEHQTKSFGDIFMLRTAFTVEYEGKRKDLESRYERRIK
jgi:hypothetical protein